jgi:hypothetical protein
VPYIFVLKDLSATGSEVRNLGPKLDPAQRDHAGANP